MKIAFICSSLEPGRDGVGDYTRRLAAELIRQGQECVILALNDKCPTKTEMLKGMAGEKSVCSGENEPVSAFKVSEFQSLQESEGTSVPCLRLPGSLGWPERTKLARQWVDEFNPDWVSLQFVPFGFHHKGLDFGLGEQLTTINSKTSWHIMFHELWLGLGEGSSVKYRAWGAMQKWIIKGMLYQLRPQVVHTQAEPYRIALNKEGITASILPLFGNIPIVAGDGWAHLLEPLVAETTGEKSDREALYLAGVFGAVHPEWDADQSVKTLLPLVRCFHKKLIIIFIGKSGLSPEKIAGLKTCLLNQASIVVVGERSADEISRLLQTLDLGLATSPRQLIQKSGSVAAMLEHGLPVLVTRDDWHLRGIKVQLGNESAGVFSPEEFARLKTLPIRDLKSSGINNVKRVANQMLEILSRNSL